MAARRRQGVNRQRKKGGGRLKKEVRKMGKNNEKKTGGRRLIRLDTDKLTAEFSLRIPEITKADIDRLSKSAKRELNDRILVTMARAIHDARFDPQHYLKSD